MDNITYIITDGINYLIENNIGTCGHTLATNKELATHWNKKKSATNVLKSLQGEHSKILGSCMSNKKKFKVVEEFKIEKENIIMSERVQPKALVELNFNIQDEVKSMKDKIILLENRNEYLQYLLSETDRKISDCLHCAEFYNLNASQGYKLYKVIHETQLQRRDIKNELQSIRYILNSNINSKSIDNIDKSIYGIYNNQKYTPRVVDELFDLLK